MLVAIRDLRKALAAAEAIVATSEVGSAPSNAIAAALDVEVFTCEANVLLKEPGFMNQISRWVEDQPPNWRS